MALCRLSSSVDKPLQRLVNGGSIYYIASLPNEAVYEKEKSRVSWPKQLNDPLEVVDSEIANIIELEKTRQLKNRFSEGQLSIGGEAGNGTHLSEPNSVDIVVSASPLCYSCSVGVTSYYSSRFLSLSASKAAVLPSSSFAPEKLSPISVSSKDRCCQKSWSSLVSSSSGWVSIGGLLGLVVISGSGFRFVGTG